MFPKFGALLLLVPAISALQLDQPTTQIRTQSPTTVTWTTASGDPATFDLYLTNDIFRNTFALKNVVTTSDKTLTVVIPVVEPGSGYTFQASPIGDVTTTLSRTAVFDIGAALSSSSVLSSSTSSGNGTTSIRPTLTTSSGPGSTVTRTSTPLGGSSSSHTSSGPTSTGSFNGGNNTGGALSVTGIGATVVGVLVAAGAFFGL